MTVALANRIASDENTNRDLTPPYHPFHLNDSLKPHCYVTTKHNLLLTGNLHFQAFKVKRNQSYQQNCIYLIFRVIAPDQSSKIILIAVHFFNTSD
ncbi:hypothetical protein P5673_016883 [Acropora cervicornis]|uniref:Uncharacterized protein n=1 Tax=Acropora cervicornis TaxID=6130 RepID=A0AAD9V483_ACRCE|nr:hypothetical protein P5673_016883 [Acropora cervicornis]